SRPDLIILDYAMPGMDGLSATRLLRKRLPETPVLLYTMHNTQQLCDAAQAAGAERVISKSETGNLVAAVQELLSPGPELGELPPPADPAAGKPIHKCLHAGWANKVVGICGGVICGELMFIIVSVAVGKLGSSRLPNIFLRKNPYAV